MKEQLSVNREGRKWPARKEATSSWTSTSSFNEPTNGHYLAGLWPPGGAPSQFIRRRLGSLGQSLTVVKPGIKSVAIFPHLSINIRSICKRCRKPNGCGAEYLLLDDHGGPGLVMETQYKYSHDIPHAVHCVVRLVIREPSAFVRPGLSLKKVYR